MLFLHQPENSRGNYSYNAYIYTATCWPLHFHRNFELIYVLHGSLSCTVDGRTEDMQAGDFALCLPSEIHAMIPEKETKYWVGVFSEDFVHAFAKEVRDMAGDGFVFRCSPSVEEFLLKNLLLPETPPVLMCKACLYAVCAEYAAKISLSPRKERGETMMRAIVDYITENYKNDISLDDMARALGYSYHYLSKCFHRIFSLSFTELLNSYRLDHALALLTETDREIADIAFESGFGSVRSFNAYFKSRIGTAPAAYRSEKKETRISR